MKISFSRRFFMSAARDRIREQILNYKPYNEQEEQDKKIMLRYMDVFEDIFTRSNEIAHFTASSWIVNKDRSKVVMIYHNIYNSWSWTGGHADGEEELLKVAIREAKEETGIEQIKPVMEDIYSLEIICVNGHVKRGKYVSSHLHLNLTYLLEAEESSELRIKEDENSGVKWVDIDKVAQESSEPCMIEIYKKLNEKLIRQRGRF
jgi:ADP-ribose pyrophosphatase YjhB (NUDIX family)